MIQQKILRCDDPQQVVRNTNAAIKFFRELFDIHDLNILYRIMKTGKAKGEMRFVHLRKNDEVTVAMVEARLKKAGFSHVMKNKGIFRDTRDRIVVTYSTQEQDISEVPADLNFYISDHSNSLMRKVLCCF